VTSVCVGAAHSARLQGAVNTAGIRRDRQRCHCNYSMFFTFLCRYSHCGRASVDGAARRLREKQIESAGAMRPRRVWRSPAGRVSLGGAGECISLRMTRCSHRRAVLRATRSATPHTPPHLGCTFLSRSPPCWRRRAHAATAALRTRAHVLLLLRMMVGARERSAVAACVWVPARSRGRVLDACGRPPLPSLLAR
jgi:hypothetical protein